MHLHLFSSMCGELELELAQPHGCLTCGGGAGLS
jgi:hypothetical protein